MAELADAYGLGPYPARVGGSSPSIGTLCYDKNMRRTALALLVIFFLSFAGTAFASSQQAYQDYLFQFDLYRQSETDFRVAKTEYEKFKSLTSETTALEKTKALLSQRDQLLRAYLSLLNERLNEDTGLTGSEKLLYQRLIQNEVVFLDRHTQLIPAIGSIADAERVSEQLTDHYDILAAGIRQTIAGIALGQLATIAQRHDQALSAAQSIIATNRGIFLPQKQATLDRWVLSITNKRSLYTQKVQAITQASVQMKGDVREVDRTFAQIQKDIAEARAYLAEATSYLSELVTALKYQD